MIRALAFAGLMALSACATSHAEAPSGPPSLAIAAGQPAPTQARFYADCISQSSAAHNYDREENLIRFHCDGATAQAFYDALADYSARVGSQYSADGRSYRFTQALQRNTTGVDYCWRADAGSYGCTLVFNAGEFLAQ